MKRLYSFLIILFLFPSMVQADVLLQEDFSGLTGPVYWTPAYGWTSPAGWTNSVQQGTTCSVGAPAGNPCLEEPWLFQSTPTFGSLSGGGYAVFDDFVLGPGVTPNEATLQTPSLNCTGRETMKLRYYHYWYGVEYTHGYVEISNDGGTSWTTLVDYENDTKGSLLAPQDTIIDISAYADNQPDVSVRFRYTDGNQPGRYWYLDDVAIYSGLDVGITALTEPASLLCGENLTVDDTIKVEVANCSFDTIWNVPINVEISGDLTTTLNEVHPFIPPLSSVIHTFNMALDLSGNNKLFIFNIYTSLGSDTYTGNDTLHASRQSIITGYPYHETLQVSNYDWQIEGDPLFEFGSFTKMNGNAQFGNSWVTGLEGNYPTSTYSNLNSPIFDFTNTPPNPTLTYDYKYFTHPGTNSHPSGDFALLEYSVDGSTWTALSDYWEGDGYANWISDTIVLDFDDCAISCVQFRFRFGSGTYNVVEGGFAFDNFKITPSIEKNDAVVEDIIYDTNCSYGAMTPIGLSIKNNNEHNLCKEVILTSVATHPNLPTQTFTDTFQLDLVGNETQDIYHAGIADFSGYNTGEYIVTSSVYFASDIDASNNTIVRNIPFVIDTYPHLQDFDADKGGWRRVGSSLNFEYGSFSKLNGNTGFGNSWVTKLTEHYATNQTSYVESPVFDITNLVCPAVSFDYKTTYLSDGFARLQYSLNGGATWTTLISVSSSGPIGAPVEEWNYSETNISQLAGNSCVQFRFSHRSNFNPNLPGGFAFDNFTLRENENNVSVTNIVAPVVSDDFCDRRTMQTITAEISNLGCTAISNIPVEVHMTGANTLSYSEVIPNTILSSQSILYTFANTLDMSDTGTYYIVVNTNFALDPDNSKDTFDIEIYEEFAVPIIDTYPHYEDFDSSLGSWFVVDDTDFEHGSFTKMNGNAGYGNSWVTKLTGNYSHSKDSYVYSPIFDLYNTPPEPILEFDYKYFTSSNSDRANLQYSLNGGQNWTVLAGDWFGNSYTSWNKDTIILDFITCDITCVQFRFCFRTNQSSNEDGGFAFDNFNITPNNLVNDAAVGDFLVNKNCSYGAAEPFGVSVINNNRYRICEEIQLTSVITHPTLPTQTLTETFTASIPSNFLQEFYYSDLIDISGYTSANYTVTSSVFFPEDIDNTNDTLVGTIPFLVTSYPYFEDFDAGTRGWSLNGDDQFELGSFTKMDGNAGFGDSWVTKLSGNYDNNIDSYVESPVFDLTNLVCPAILFDYKSYTESCCDEAILQYSLNGGANWSYLTGDWGGNAYTSWNRIEYNIESLAGNSCVQFRFRFRSDGSSTRNGGFAFDSFLLTENENNLSVINILKPEAEGDLCDRRTAETIQVEIYNGGCNTVTNIPIEVNMTGALSQNINETITDPIASNETYTYTFTNTLNMSDTGTYFLHVNTNFAPDPVNKNDTSFTAVYEEFAKPYVDAFPYTENFDTSMGNWFLSGQTQFELGAFTKMGGNAGYGDTWVTKLVGDYDNSIFSSRINSPFFDFTNLQCPSIHFNYKVFSEAGDDRATLQYSTDRGDSWTTLSTYSGNNYSTWNVDDINLSGLAGNSCVMFRFIWRADGSNNRDGGFAFDNILIQDNDFNLSVVQLIDPGSNLGYCYIRDQQAITVELYNNGCSDITNVPIELSLSGQNTTTFTDTIPGPIPDQEAFFYTFNNTVDLSDTGTYNFVISTNAPNDPNTDDTLKTTILRSFESTYVNTFPYYEDFNAGAGNWISTGNNPLELGTFTKMYGNSGFGDSWVTELSGDYLNNTNASVISPTFDFTNTVCPVISFDHKYFTEYSRDTISLQYSLDGGITWIHLSKSWIYFGFTDWTHENHNVNWLAGNACVNFRFWFQSNFGLTREGGFAFDNFEINDVSADAAVDNVVACWGSTYDFEVTVKNNIDQFCTQQDSIEHITIEFSVDGVTGAQTYSGLNIQSGTVEVLTLNNILIPSANSTIKIWPKLPNSIIDPIHENDTLTLNASILPNCNDHCSNAQLLTIGTTTASQTSYATQNVIEDPLFTNCGPITVENTVWYSFRTDQVGGMVTVGFENIACTPSTNGIQVSIDELTGPPCMISSLNNIYCNSPSNTTNFQYGPVLLPPNMTYYIIVDGFAGNNCDFDIVLDGAIFNPIPSGSVLVSAGISCVGKSDGVATVTASNGLTPYTYLWDNGETTPSVTNLSVGGHFVTVTESAGHSFIAFTVITQPAPLDFNLSHNNHITCNGLNDGSVTIQPLGGTPNYSFLWDNGGTLASPNNLSQGLHSVTITDQNGCSITTAMFISEPAILTATAVEGTPIYCNGLSNGSATATATGGNPGYSFVWDNGESTATATSLTGGNHTVSVSDANGCITTTTVSITEPLALLAASINENNPVSCSGQSDAAVTVQGSNGLPPYTYRWNTGATSASINNLVSGNYTVSVTDANGCITSSSISITEPAAVSAFSIENTSVTCFGGSDGTGTIMIDSGGVPPFAYLWDNGQTSASANNLSAGMHAVSVTDANGCLFTENVLITEPLPILAVTFENTSVTCNGLSDGTGTVKVNFGGVPPFAYLWDNGQTSASANNLSAGMHTVSVTDANGCLFTENVLIREPYSILAVSFENTSVTCNGLSDGTGTVKVNFGGVAPYLYVWDNGETSDLATALNAGLHRVTITDANGCMVTTGMTTSEPNLLSANIVSNTPVSCNGYSDGMASITHSGGTFPYNYLWSDGTTSMTATSLIAGLYWVTMTDSNGCTTTASTLITQPATLQANTSILNAVSCNGLSDGSATVTPTDGISPYNILWDNEETGTTATALTAGIHTITTTDANGCTVTSNITITEPATLLSSATLGNPVTCNGESNGTATISASSGTIPYFFAWDNGETTATASALSAGNHRATVTDSNGCVATSELMIVEPTAIAAIASEVGSVVCSGLSDGSASVIATGGDTPYSFLWDNGETTSTATNLINGTHSVVVTDAVGCSIAATVSISINSTDSDNDGVCDLLDIDDDNDGIPDIVEMSCTPGAIFGDSCPMSDPGADDDDDGIVNYQDPDWSDCGNLNTNGTCESVDADGDGLPNHLDLDADGDGLSDIIEGGGIDENMDGEVDYPTSGDAMSMTDTDGDGMSDDPVVDTTGDGVADTPADDAPSNPGTTTGLPIPNTEGTGAPDFLDIDADDDGIPDRIEAATAINNGDTDLDGILDHLDLDADNDGINDIVEAGGTDANEDGLIDTPTDEATLTNPTDSDSDNTPDFQETDSDDDGINDISQTSNASLDADGDGVIDNISDPDRDGIANIVDGQPTIFGDDRNWLLVDVKLLLQGPYNVGTGLMTTNLVTSGLLSFLEPYTSLGYTHLGGGNEMVAQSVLDVTGADAIVDWVFLEIRDASAFQTVLGTRSALLQADGDVVELDGVSKVQVNNLPVGNYYIVARHRNHLDIMTPDSVPLEQTDAATVLHDFTVGLAYGSTSMINAQKNLTAGIFGLFEADFNNNGEINAGDRSIAWNSRNQTGYLVEDSNFDGVCDAAERSQCWNNRNKLSYVP